MQNAGLGDDFPLRSGIQWPIMHYPHPRLDPRWPQRDLGGASPYAAAAAAADVLAFSERAGAWAGGSIVSLRSRCLGATVGCWLVFLCVLAARALWCTVGVIGG